MRKSISNEKRLLQKLNIDSVEHYARKNSAITLVALIVTIVVLLILGGVTLKLIVGTDGIIGKAVTATKGMNAASAKERAEMFFAGSKIDYVVEKFIKRNKDAGTIAYFFKKQIDEDSEESGRAIGNYYITMDDDGNVTIYAGNTEESVNESNELLLGKIDELGKIDWKDASDWNAKAAPENVFIWKSDDPTSEDYGTITGYKTNMDNYPTLRFPTRCTRIIIDNSAMTAAEQDQVRSYTKNIHEIELPNTVIEIGNDSFSEWDLAPYKFGSLEKVTIPDSVTTIGTRAFEKCYNLTNLTIGNSVTSIGSSAFASCKITSITIPNSVTSIGSNAFYSTSLKNIVIGDNVTSIGRDAFRTWGTIDSITFRGKTYTDKTELNNYLKTEGIAEYDVF